MASTILVKRSTGTSVPSSLEFGELALTVGTGTQVNRGDRIFIGDNNTTVQVIGGKYFTDMLDHVHGVLTPDSGVIVDNNSKVDRFRVDDINNVDPILYRPKHKFISSIKHKSKNISNIISMRYQSKQDYQDFLSDDREYEGSEIKFPIEQLDSLILFNYIGTYELNNNDKVSLKISNLFDKQYELIQDFPCL